MMIDLVKLFTFLVLVALAAIGMLEWLKSLLLTVKTSPWLWTVLSAIICVAAGIGSVMGGLFSDFFTPPSLLPGLGAGIVVGLIALAFVEVAYQQIYKLTSTFVTWLVDKMSKGT
jgi:hypothetical protein